MNYSFTRIREAMLFEKPVYGLTHNFYKYPGRFSPVLAKEIINQFSNENDWVLDPFMGGGTTIIEAITLGRKSIGIDINSLAWFISLVKSTPIYNPDITKLLEWSERIKHLEVVEDNFVEDPIENISISLSNPLKKLLKKVDYLDYPRIQKFARCAILRVGQKIIDGKREIPIDIDLNLLVRNEIKKMIAGTAEFVQECEIRGIKKKEISNRRKLFNCSVQEINKKINKIGLDKKVRLVFTSPPYPGVHVLYHRWQIQSRKETDAPYIICGFQDGRSEIFYTMGGRSKQGIDHYFSSITDSFKAIKPLLDKNSMVVQLIGFSNAVTQMPKYLKSMEEAGYQEIFPLFESKDRLWRLVPNRKWYAHSKFSTDSSSEVLLFHRLI